MKKESFVTVPAELFRSMLEQTEDGKNLKFCKRGHLGPKGKRCQICSRDTKRSRRKDLRDFRPGYREEEAKRSAEVKAKHGKPKP